MPLLAGVLVTIFEKLLTFFGTYFGRKLTIGAALGTFLIAGIVAVQAAFYALFLGLGTFVASPFMNGVIAGVCTLLPSNFGLCVTALVSGKITLFVWRKQKEWARMTSYVT